MARDDELQPLRVQATRRVLFGRLMLLLVMCVVAGSAGIAVWWGLALFLQVGMVGMKYGSMYTALTLPPLVYAALVIVPSLLVMVVLLPVALAWRHAPCIVVFRRFHQHHRAFRLQHLLTKHVAPFGHVFTLADSDVPLPWNVRVPILIGNLGFLNFRPRKITGPRSLRRLARALDVKWLLNVNWLVSRRKIFAVRSSDAMWQPCVNELLRHADAVLMDLSSISPSLEWEAGAIESHRLTGRLLVVVDGSDDADAAASHDMRSRHPVLASAPLVDYGRVGEPDDPAALQDWLGQVLASRAARPAPTDWRSGATAIAVFLARPLAAALVIAALVSPFWLPRWTLAYSPFASQIVYAYLHGDLAAAVDGSMDAQTWMAAREVGLERLARDHPERATPLLLQQMRTHGMYVQFRTAHALGKIGDPRAIDLLVQLVSGPPPGVSYRYWVTADHHREWFDTCRSALAQIVARHGEAAALPLLEALLRHTDWPPDAAALEPVIPYLDRPATRPLVDKLAAEGRSGRRAGALIEGLRLAHAGQPGGYALMRDAGIEWMTEGVRDHPEASHAAARLIVRYADDASLHAVVSRARDEPHLLRALVSESRSPDASRAARALAALEAWPAQDLREELWWDDRGLEEILIGVSAAYALAQRGDAQGAVALVHCFVKGRCDSLPEALAMDGLAAYLDRRGAEAPCSPHDPDVEPARRHPHGAAFAPAAGAMAARDMKPALRWLTRCFIEHPDAARNDALVARFARALPSAIRQELRQHPPRGLPPERERVVRHLLDVE